MKYNVKNTQDTYPRTRKVIELSMKIVQRELGDGRLKVDLLTGLLELREKLDNDGRTERPE